LCYNKIVTNIRSFGSVGKNNNITDDRPTLVKNGDCLWIREIGRNVLMVRALGDADFCRNAANAYLQTAIYCNEVDKIAASQTIQFVDQAFFAIPAITNVAFACELFLKAIGLQTNPSGALKGHTLSTLYEDLESQQRADLEGIFSRHCTFKSVTLESTLRKHSRVFENWRYIYENEKNTNSSVCEVYIENLFSAAISLRDYVDTLKMP
jgi:hypothetical protein